MHRAALADKARAKFFEDTIRLHEHPPKPVGILRVVRVMSFILIEGDGIGNLVGLLIDVYLNIELPHFVLKLPVERCDRLGLQGKPGEAAVAGLKLYLMTDEVKVDLKRPVSLRNGAGGKTPGRNVQGHVPRMIDPWTLRQANLANDLRPHVQSRRRIAPGIEREAGPGFNIRNV
jgi:hypothetical protein